MRYQDMSVLGSYGRYQYQHRIRNDGGVTAAAISAGAALTSAGVSMTVGGKMNKRAAHEARRARAWQTAERVASQEYQRQMYEQQLQDTYALRDYDNQWNSLQAQKQRALDAGFSPLSVLGMSGANGTSDANLAAAPGTPSDPGASLPQMFNPMQGAAQMADAFAQFSNAMTQRESMENQAIGIKADAAYKDSLRATEDQLRDGKLVLQGIEIEIGQLTKDMKKSEIRKLAADTLKAQKDIELADKYMEYYGVQMDYIQFQKWLQKQNYSLEVKKVMSRVALEQATRVSVNIGNRMAHKYESEVYDYELKHQKYQMQSADWNTNVQNQMTQRFVDKGYADESQDLQMRMMRAGVSQANYDVKMQLSDLGIAVHKATRLVGGLMSIVGQGFQSYSQYAVGKAGLARANQIMNSAGQTGNVLTPMNQTEFNPFGF